MISPLSNKGNHPHPTFVVKRSASSFLSNFSTSLFETITRFSCFVFVNHISTIDRIIASCCHPVTVTFSHPHDVLVVALDMLKIPNARYSTKYGFLHFHCPAMIFGSIVNHSCGK